MTGIEPAFSTSVTPNRLEGGSGYMGIYVTKIGLKPITYGLGNRCSVQLSYKAIIFVGEVGFEPTFSSFRYRYRMYKIPLLPAHYV